MGKAIDHRTTRARFAVLLALSVIGGCNLHRDEGGAPGIAETMPDAADREAVIAQGDGVTDADGARRFVMLRLARDCLAKGFQSFAFTAVSEPKPRLPNREFGARVEYDPPHLFDPPTTTIPDIVPGTEVAVKFYKAGDPTAQDAMDAGMIKALVEDMQQRK
ncbi:MAG: hypothetical protein ABSD74_15435 [Rhizomicrobium sp.]